MRRAHVLLLVLLYASVAFAAAVTFKLSADAGATTRPAGLTDARFPPPAAPRDPIVETCITLDVVCRTMATPAVPATDSAPGVAAVWTTSTYRRDFFPSDVTFEQGAFEYADYVRVWERGTSKDGMCACYVRGDLRTLQALRDKARGANPAWLVTFDESR